MTTDRYTKAVLTVIAVSLVVLIVQNTTGTAEAQRTYLACQISNPCYVTNSRLTPLSVVIAHTPAQSRGQVRGIPPNSGQMK